MRIPLLFCLSAAIALSTGCVKAVTTTAGVATKAGAGAVKAGAGVAGAAASAASSDRSASDDEHHGHDDGPRPYDETRDAVADVNAAFAAAAVSGRNVLIPLGGNWCHDSRGLAANFQKPELAEVISDHYELVWVDMGYLDRNLDIPATFEVFELHGTPTVLIVSPEGVLLNRESMHQWRNADSIPYADTLAYFQRFAGVK